MLDRLKELQTRMPKRSSGIDTYNAILESAEMIFVLKGIRNTTISSIINKAGIATQSFYDYFPEGKPDLVAMLHHYRRRRMKHAIRSAASQIVISYKMPELDPAEAPIPVYLACRILVGAIFRTMREKPELDREILSYMLLNNMETTTQQEMHIKDEIIDALATISHGTMSGVDLDTIAFIATFASKGVIEAAILTGQSLDAKFEAALVQSVSLLLAQQIATSGNCAGCRTVQKLNREHGMFPMEQPVEKEPVTRTIPKTAVRVPEALVQHLRRPGDSNNVKAYVPEEGEILPDYSMPVNFEISKAASTK